MCSDLQRVVRSTFYSPHSIDLQLVEKLKTLEIQMISVRGKVLVRQLGSVLEVI